MIVAKFGGSSVGNAAAAINIQPIAKAAAFRPVTAALPGRKRNSVRAVRIQKRPAVTFIGNMGRQ